MVTNTSKYGPAMLSGLTGVGDSMFSALGGPDPRKSLPDPKEMLARMDAAQHIRYSELKNFTVRTYDLSLPDDIAQYCKDREWVMVGMSMATHALIQHEKQFVATLDPPRWMAHMEWMEFTLTEKAVPTIGNDEENDDEDYE